ncbi:MAG: UPF0758 domain-containing protein [Chloroflexota bacterium]
MRGLGWNADDAGGVALSEAELLAVVIGTGVKGRPATAIAADLLAHYGSLAGMSNMPLERLLEVKGLADAKIVRL